MFLFHLDDHFSRVGTAAYFALTYRNNANVARIAKSVKTNSIINFVTSSARAYLSESPVGSLIVTGSADSAGLIKTVDAEVDVITRPGAVLTIRMIPKTNVKTNTKIRTTPETNKIAVLSNLDEKLEIYLKN
jgi:hypothetical protein